MRSLFLYTAGMLAMITTTTADAATFRVEYDSRGFVVLSTFEKPETCEMNVFFTYMHEGKRAEGQTRCLPKAVADGKDVEFCKFSHDRLVDPAESKPPMITCTPTK